MALEKEYRIVPVRNWDPHTINCIKCNADEEHLKYQWMNGGTGFVNGINYQFPEKFEFLFMKCNRCSHEWIMQTADANDRKTAEEDARLEKEIKEEEEQEAKEEKSGESKGHAHRKVSKGY